MLIIILMLLLLMLTSEFEEVKQETNKQQDENKKTRKIDEECHYIFDFYSLKVSMGVLLFVCVCVCMWWWIKFEDYYSGFSSRSLCFLSNLTARI